MNLAASQPLAVITGAAGGLAPAVARSFAAAGYRLALVTRPGREDSLGPSPHPVFGIDLAAPEACAVGFERLVSEAGPPSALVNLAGGYGRGGSATATGGGPGADVQGGRSEAGTTTVGPIGSGVRSADAAVESMLTINLRTAVNATSAVLPGMLARGSGFIAAVAAGAALAPAPGATAYAASKAALAAYFRSLAAEVGAKGVNVALLVPVGAIDTPANRAAMPKADPSGWLDPEALARGLVYLSTLGARGRVHELTMTAV